MRDGNGSLERDQLVISYIMQLVLKTEAQDSKNLTVDHILPAISTRNPRLMELQGECRIHSIRPLRFDCLKTILLLPLLILTVIPLLLLKYYKSFRVRCFYKDVLSQQADYVFVEGIDGNQDIEDVIRQEENIFFFFKKLKYRYEEGAAEPVGFRYEEVFTQLFSDKYQGADEARVNMSRAKFGRNEHRVQIPGYLSYLIDVMLKPFFLMQYGVCVIFGFQNLLLYIYLYIGFSFITTTINYILLYLSFKRIQQIAEKETEVTVQRSGKVQKIMSHDLVPGDIVMPQLGEEICFDGILITGEVFLNQASLTGESVPVGKFPAENVEKAKLDNRWLFEGGKVLQSREDSRVLVVNVGYATRRGRIIRKILTRVPAIPDFFLTAVYFLVQTCIVGIILYLATLKLMLGGTVATNFIVFRLLDIIAWSFPPTFPIFFNISYSFSLTRLKWAGIFGTEPEKATEAANIKTFCFDKTGTLTQNEVQVFQVVRFLNEKSTLDVTADKLNPDNKLLLQLFASCHAVRHVEGTFLGDEVDLRMFLFSGYNLAPASGKDVRFCVDNGSDRLQILRINQFESKFQNMSVLVREPSTGKHFIFLKGAPERIDARSLLKLQGFQDLVAGLSLRGYRTIAFAYREVTTADANNLLNGGRQLFEEGVRSLGVVAFENKLKDDTRATIDLLVDSDIEPKMITGDNIFIAVETGFRAGILREGQSVILIEGRKQPPAHQQERKFRGIKLNKSADGKVIQEEILLSEQEYLTQQANAIAIDNDFLTLDPAPALPPSIKLFARISPENKALIVRKFKEEASREYASRSKRARWFGPGCWKVGMCGDGANDLMAIRQACVGVGISDSDASYGASFTVSTMLQVEHIVRESKCASQSIVDMIRYFGTISFLKIITSIILLSDLTYFGSTQITYFNFAHSIWLAVFLGLSSTATAPTRQRPLNNLMSFENHLLYWGNIILPTAGFVAGYFYFKSTDSWASNTNIIVDSKLGYLGIICGTNTVTWLMINIPFIANAFLVYTGAPFKSSFFRNIPLMVLTLLNAIAAIAFFFITNKLPPSFQLTSLSAAVTGPILGILGGSVVLTYILSEIYHKVVHH